MGDSAQIGILRRKARPAPARRPRDAAADVWRRVLPRLAADGLGLELSVSGVRDGACDLHTDLAVEEGALLLFLSGAEGAPAGLAVLDAALLAALVEVQATGRVSSQRREPRRATAVDAALARHVLDDWLTGIGEARGEFAVPLTWGAAPDLRAALLKLEEGAWSETQVDLDLGGGKRSGRLSLYLPVPAARAARPAEPEALQSVLLPAETTLEAVLCRVRVPLATIALLAPGQLVALPGVSLRRIALEAPRGRHVAEVHLGQSRGFRAVRILEPEAQGDVARPMPPQLDAQDLLPDLGGGGFPGESLPGL